MPVSDEVFPEVYEELRQLAASKMARERCDHTLQATALVHEAWLKVSAEREDHWERTQFYMAAAAAHSHRSGAAETGRETRRRRGA